MIPAGAHLSRTPHIPARRPVGTAHFAYCDYFSCFIYFDCSLHANSDSDLGLGRSKTYCIVLLVTSCSQTQGAQGNSSGCPPFTNKWFLYWTLQAERLLAGGDAPKPPIEFFDALLRDDTE
jgi:hypothetical protein